MPGPFPRYPPPSRGYNIFVIILHLANRGNKRKAWSYNIHQGFSRSIVCCVSMYDSRLQTESVSSVRFGAWYIIHTPSHIWEMSFLATANTYAYSYYFHSTMKHIDLMSFCSFHQGPRPRICYRMLSAGILGVTEPAVMLPEYMHTLWNKLLTGPAAHWANFWTLDRAAKY